MNQYYLIAQLPSLDVVSETTPLPITEERFYELCSRHLGKKALRALNGLTLIPARQSKASGYKIIDAWYENERQLRFALALVRAEKMNKSFDEQKKALEKKKFSKALLQTAETAADMQDPLAAEKFLNSVRLNFLESLRPSDPFSENMLFYYGLKLKLILRIRQFDESIGRNVYRNIYDSIVRGGEQEVQDDR